MALQLINNKVHKLRLPYYDFAGPIEHNSSYFLVNVFGVG